MDFAVQDNFEQIVKENFATNHFAKEIGFVLTEIAPGITIGELPLRQALRQQDEFAHGGIVITLCDVVAGLAAYTLVRGKERVVTAEIKVSFLKPGRGDKLIAKGWVIKPGRNLYFCESEVYDIGEDGKPILIAKSSSSMAARHPISE